MTSQTYKAMLPEIERIAREAGELVRSGYRRGASHTRTDVSKKGAIDLVTEFDLKSEAHIVRELGRVFPDIAIVGEEGQGKRAVTEAADSALRFFVDPIDGTTNFAHGHPFFCVSIGLCAGVTPVAGVIYAPILEVCWAGAVGSGATRNGESCLVSSCEELGEALCATGFGYDVAGKVDDNVAEFGAIQARARGVRRCGAAALDLALVADGTYDAYWEFMLQPWDLAAGAALVLAAGGQATGFSGQPLDALEGAVVATSTPALSRELVSMVQQVRGGRPVPTR
ncbi:MAG: inositol monophosphatase family protein [Myxococcales bacterium]